MGMENKPMETFRKSWSFKKMMMSVIRPPNPVGRDEMQVKGVKEIVMREKRIVHSKINELIVFF